MILFDGDLKTYMLNLEEEKNIFNQGYKLIAGIDEAGRGPLAGPVVAACVVLSNKLEVTRLRPECSGLRQGEESKKFLDVKDSKKLSAKKREELALVIRENFKEVGVGICGHITIDKINILQAAFLAMKKAIGALKDKPDFIILDGGFKIPNMSYAQKNIIRGDELVFSIAAASIIAKVERDRIMREMHELYPQYGFREHKGYGTRRHLENLKKYGPSPIHRLSFRPVRNLLKDLK